MKDNPHNNPEMYTQAYQHVAKTLEHRIVIPIGCNATYTQHDIMAEICYTATGNGGRKSFNRGFGQLACQGLTIPNDDTVLYHLAKINEQDMNTAFGMLMSDVIGWAQGSKPFPEDIVVATDYTYEPFAGDRNISGVVGMKKVRGTNWGFGFLTIEIAMPGLRFCIGMKTVEPLENGKMRLEAVLKDSNRCIGRHNVINLADKEFFSDAYLSAFLDAGHDFLVPVRLDKRISGTIQGYQGYLFKVYPYIFKKGTVNFNIVTVWQPPKKGDLPDATGSYFIYATNRNPNTYDDALALAKLYRSRWGIETGYRTKKYEFMIKTCSTRTVIRRFIFALVVALYNIWRLLNYWAEHDKKYAHLKRYRRAWEFMFAIGCSFYGGPRQMAILVNAGIG